MAVDPDPALPPLKLDVGPPAWLAATPRPFVPTNIHARYDVALPDVAVIQFAENLAERIARLTRVSTARDAADLWWAATTTPHSNSDRKLVRQLAVLKVWVDNHGLDGHWAPADRAAPFDPAHWLRRGRNWDDEQIRFLTHPSSSSHH